MDFLDIKTQFENDLSDNRKFEMLELHYYPYDFGSGISIYKIYSRAVKLIFDGKDKTVQLDMGERHTKHPKTSFITIFLGQPDDFVKNHTSIMAVISSTEK